VWEILWAAKAAAAIRNADGQLMLYERIPGDQVQKSWVSALRSDHEIGGQA
jgi:hypothetical protein